MIPPGLRLFPIHKLGEADFSWLTNIVMRDPPPSEIHYQSRLPNGMAPRFATRTVSYVKTLIQERASLVSQNSRQVAQSAGRIGPGLATWTEDEFLNFKLAGRKNKKDVDANTEASFASEPQPT
jgi:hypothetical protein